MPHSLYSTHSLPAENILNFYFLKGIAEDKKSFTEDELLRATLKVIQTTTGLIKKEPLFDARHTWGEEVAGFVRCDDASAYLSFLDGMKYAVAYDPKNFILCDSGKRYIAESASRFSIEARASAQTLAHTLETNLENILVTAVGLIVAKDPYAKTAH